MVHACETPRVCARDRVLTAGLLTAITNRLTWGGARRWPAPPGGVVLSRRVFVACDIAITALPFYAGPQNYNPRRSSVIKYARGSLFCKCRDSTGWCSGARIGSAQQCVLGWCPCGCEAMCRLATSVLASVACLGGPAFVFPLLTRPAWLRHRPAVQLDLFTRSGPTCWPQRWRMI
jgi:hypothetical protein